MYRLRKVGRYERKFLGVCGGISKYIDRELDPVIIRMLWVVLSCFSPLMILLYFILALLLRPEDDNRKTEPVEKETVESPFVKHDNGKK